MLIGEWRRRRRPVFAILKGLFVVLWMRLLATVESSSVGFRAGHVYVYEYTALNYLYGTTTSTTTTSNKGSSSERLLQSFTANIQLECLHVFTKNATFQVEDTPHETITHTDEIALINVQVNTISIIRVRLNFFFFLFLFCFTFMSVL